MVLCDVRRSDAKDCSYGDCKNDTDVLGAFMRVGLFMMDVNYQNKGIGSKVIGEVLSYLKVIPFGIRMVL